MSNLFRITENNLENFFHYYQNKKKINNEQIDKDKNFKNYYSENLNSNIYLNENTEKNKLKNVLWEFGKYRIKMHKLKSDISINIIILNYLNNIIIDFIKLNPILKLKNIFEVFNKELNNIFNNDIGSININFNNVYIKINKNKISGTYKILNYGYVQFYDKSDELINIKNNDSILKYPDNIKYFYKIINILNDKDITKLQSNFLIDFNFKEIINNHFSDILLKINNKDEIFKSDNNFYFYMKIYHNNTRFVIINKSTKLIYYFCFINKNYDNFLFLIMLELDSKYKIINYDKIKENQTENINDIITKKINDQHNDSFIYIIPEMTSSLSNISEISEVTDLSE